MHIVENESRDPDAQCRGWVIFVVNKVPDRPNQVRYQRFVALAQGFNLIVVTNADLPQALKDLAQEVYLVNKMFSTWSMVIRIAKRLKQEGNTVYVHTQYSPNPAIAGYLCKQRVGCKWIYDLWDHPSLGYMSMKGPSRWVRQFIWTIVRHWMLDKADAWIIAMHPAILGYMPPAPVSCQLIFSQPGCHTDPDMESDDEKQDSNSEDAIKIVYAGMVALQRGLSSIMQWALRHHGALVELHLIGPCLDSAENMLGEFERKCEKNPDLSLKIHGELPHPQAMKIIRASHIGLCPLDISVLNYRFAFPVKVVEQMHLGLIVVATQTHGTGAFIEDGINGILAENRKDGLGKALDRAIRVCKDSETQKSMCNAAMETVRDHRWSIVNKRLVERLKTVLGA